MRKLLLLMFVTSLVWGQDFTLHVPGTVHTYTLPVDTCFRQVNIDNWVVRPSSAAPIFSLELTFPDSLETPVEYLFLGFLHGRMHAERYNDTLNLTATPYSLNDSIWIEEVEFDGDTLWGVRYLNFPGDSVSGFDLDMSSDTIDVYLDHLRFQVAANMASNWLNFQPMALGNIWKYMGPFPFFERERWEVIDTFSSVDTTFFIVEQQKKYLDDFNGAVVFDTLDFYILEGDKHHVFADSYGFRGPKADFTPTEGLYEGDFEGLIPMADGSLAYGYIGLGGSRYHKYGIGFAEDFGDGFGQIMGLVGYTVNGVSSGDISTMVAVDDDFTSQPDQFELSAFPNPFNASLNIHYTLSKNAPVSLTIYNMNGTPVHEQVSAMQVKGDHQYFWTAPDNLASGVYFIHIGGQGLSYTQKVLLLK